MWFRRATTLEHCRGAGNRLARARAGFRGQAGAGVTAALAVAAAAVAFAVPSPAEPPTRILVLGDSLTSGYGLPPADAFPARLEGALRDRGIDARVLNAGVSGDTTAGGRARLAWALADRPDYAIVALGANDGLRGLDPAETRANLAAILDGLRRAGVRTLLVGMCAPPNLGRAYGDAFNRVFPDLARAFDVPFYPFFLDGVAGRPELLQADGLHPNARGVGVMVKRLLPLVEALVGRGRAGARAAPPPPGPCISPRRP